MPNSRTKDTDDSDWETVFHRDQATGKSPSPGKGKAKLDGKDKPEGKTDIKTRSNCLIGKRPWSSVSPPKAKMDPKGLAIPTKPKRNLTPPPKPSITALIWTITFQKRFTSKPQWPHRPTNLLHALTGRMRSQNNHLLCPSRKLNQPGFRETPPNPTLEGARASDLQITTQTNPNHPQVIQRSQKEDLWSHLPPSKAEPNVHLPNLSIPQPVVCCPLLWGLGVRQCQNPPMVQGDNCQSHQKWILALGQGWKDLTNNQNLPPRELLSLFAQALPQDNPLLPPGPGQPPLGVIYEYHQQKGQRVLMVEVPTQNLKTPRRKPYPQHLDYGNSEAWSCLWSLLWPTQRTSLMSNWTTAIHPNPIQLH
jgi:hypothetical protein